MKLTKAIDRDCKCLRNYFCEKFNLLKVALDEEMTAPVVAEDADADESRAAYHRFSHLIIPDIAINTYSLLEWWLRSICEFQRGKKKLDKTYKKYQTTNKPENDFDRYHKYLTEYAGIDLTSVEDSRDRIDSLRKVRNRLIHHGGDIPSNEEDEYSCIDGITVMSLPPIHYLVIEDDFIWDMGEHVQKYLHKAVVS
jgi:hypothetical protein